MTRRHGRGSPVAPPLAPAVSTDPLAGVERVYIDGSNLLHALARGSGAARGGGAGTGGAPSGPAGAVIGRLRAAFPPSVVVDLIFDGPAWGGIKGRLATGLRVAYSGRATADSIIDEGVAAQLAADGPAGTWGILVVTDDRGLGDLVRAKGARVARTAWLAGRIGHMTSEPPRPGPGMRGHGDEPARRGPSAPRPKSGTEIGHRRPLRSLDDSDRD